MDELVEVAHGPRLELQRSSMGTRPRVAPLAQWPDRGDASGWMATDGMRALLVLLLEKPLRVVVGLPMSNEFAVYAQSRARP